MARRTQTPLFDDGPIVGPDGTEYYPSGHRVTPDQRISYLHPERSVPTVDGHDLAIYATLVDNEDSNGRTPYDRLMADSA